MYTKVALVAILLAGTANGVAIQKRDGAHAHGSSSHSSPSSGYSAPSSGYSAPSSSYGAPAAAPASSYGAPAASYGAPAAAPASSYGAPAASYGAPAAAPASSYGAPAASYGAPAAAPASSYGAPAASYGAPATGYGAEAAAPAYGAEGADVAGGFPPILPIIAAIIGLIGLSLLFPAFVTVAVTGRRKRSAEEASPMYDLAERVNDIYGAVLESEECMEKIACEAGAMVRDVKELTQFSSLAAPFVPSKYNTYYKQFRSGKNCDKLKCGNKQF